MGLSSTLSITFRERSTLKYSAMITSTERNIRSKFSLCVLCDLCGKIILLAREYTERRFDRKDDHSKIFITEKKPFLVQAIQYPPCCCLNFVTFFHGILQKKHLKSHCFRVFAGVFSHCSSLIAKFPKNYSPLLVAATPNRWFTNNLIIHYYNLNCFIFI